MGYDSRDREFNSRTLRNAIDMARSDLLISLVRAGASGDRAMLKSATEALVAEERAQNHHIVADRLERALSTVAVTPPALTAASSPAGSGKDTILELEPRLQLNQLMLPLPVEQGGRQLIEEHTRADVLRAHGYEPRHRVLLSGPPGNGKTSFAEAVAEALGLPFFVVRYDALIGSYLGETNARLRKLFDYVRTRPSVLFFDEFDSIGKERGDTHETGEIKRVVSFLLMQLDQLPSYVVVIAATNHAELLDRAVWRRFQMRLAFPAPDRQRIGVFLDHIISQWPDAPKAAAKSIAAKLGTVSFAEALDFCQNVRRRQILGLGELSIDDALRSELDLWATRVSPEVLNGERSDQTDTETASERSAAKSTRPSSGRTRPSTKLNR
ncbi:putative ATPase [Rhizobium rhizogenes NBRC 13257]|uniref:ATPase n=3 Tax=Rhizobium/Agrobacterium group TaxID=227290 RepID=A0AA87QDW6_RHIRH|nr:putative ATPase [Rhizobium rhizogenes NBRC 13257]